jgi:cytochrome P450
MKKESRHLTPRETQRLTQRYQELAERLARVGAISQGSVMHAPPGAWRWTRKVKAKTVSVALSAGQAELMKQAIANQRELDAVIDEMREITQQLILGTTPDVPRRPRSKKLPNHA